MSTNPQWKSFQPPDTMNQDSAIIDFKSLTSNGKLNRQKKIVAPLVWKYFLTFFYVEVGEVLVAFRVILLIYIYF